MEPTLEVKSLVYAHGAMLAFVVTGDTVTFCGTSNIRWIPEEDNTTNAAPIILEILARAVGRPAETLRFCELLTHTSWVLPRGEYDLQEVRRVGTGTSWKRTPCSEQIIEAFRSHISGNAAPKKYVPPRGGTLRELPALNA